MGAVAYFALSSIVEAEASEVILPDKLMVNVSEFLGKNKILNNGGSAKMIKKE